VVGHPEEIDVAVVEDPLDLGPLGRVVPQPLRGPVRATTDHQILSVIREPGVGPVKRHPLSKRAKEAVTDEE
jgi:hypothetical protein